MLSDNKINLGSNIQKSSRNDKCDIYEMVDENGEGTMTAFNVFPGIVVMYNDFHMGSCNSKFESISDIICIDYCREGRIEWKLSNDTYFYVESGDLQISTKNYHNGNFEFPLHHYHGISVCFYLKEATKTLKNIFGGFSVDLYKLKEKFLSNDSPVILKAEQHINNIFLDLYTVSDSIKEEYFKIKVLELLLYLEVSSVPANRREKSYFYKSQVEKIKRIKEFITVNQEKHFTLKELSEKFEIPLTSMKQCFKGVYGTSIYSYLRAYRMNTAATMLIKTKENISVIAGKVGYDNSSKFSSAFKNVMGKSPQEYRKSFV
ncbi:MAG: helix-turn-helix transcriptional regulator [Clostridium sp.]|nr:helix-turn-helix transcriptional regulator [Clostridium sp.]